MVFTNPKVDVVEEKSGLFKVAVELPGIEKQDVKIDLEANILSIKATSCLCYDEKTIFVQECNKYHFYRQITLPIHPEPSTCSTSFEIGRLNITIKPTSTKAVPIHIL
ncbi:hypothetical protein BDC45DRAFT_496814 [Circinella umbellata]|nr:hypothetical protein BDC45DRAFT_496814 [Circinella umbellata]